MLSISAVRYAKRIRGTVHIYKISTSNRRIIRQVKRNRIEVDRFIDPLPCELDNHADTTCFGKNFRVISFTSEVCSVSPYLSEYDSLEDIPICTAATAVELESGETIILKFGQGLWFGDRMEHSLINPNQCRSYGIRVCDDPTDEYRKLGMELSDDYVVPFLMKGTTCYFESRSPDLSEIETCRTFLVSDPDTWDPTSELFRISAVGRGPMSVSVSNLSASNLCDLCLYEFYDFDYLQKSDIAQIRTSKRHHGVDANLLSLKWGIGLEKARNTIKYTTQMNVRSALLPLTRRYRTDLLSQRLKRLNTRFYTDTMFSKIGTSLRGNTCTQIFTDGNGAVFAYPMRSKAQAGDKLLSLIQQVGIPNELHRDGAPEMGGNSKFNKICQEHRIRSSYTEPHSPWQNKCENIIGVISKKLKARRARRRIPKCIWDYHIVWEAQVYTRTVHKNNHTSLEALTGDTTDISEWIEFEFYDLCLYWDNRDGDTRPSIGRWLGPSHHIGSALCYYILTEKATVVSRTSVQHITKEEFETSEMKVRVAAYHESLDKYIDAESEYTNGPDGDDFVKDDEELPVGYEENGDYFGSEDAPDIDDIIDNENERTQSDSYDKYIGTEIVLPNSADQNLIARVKKKVRSDDKNTPDYYNPIRDHSVYEVQFPDGTTDEVEANMIAESMVAECDSEGRRFQIFNEISDHRKDDTALSVAEGSYMTRAGNPISKKTTRGWHILIEWRDGSMDWHKLAEVKDAYPVQLAEYAIANGIDHEPAFKWWVRKTIKRKDRMISKVKSKYWKNTHKFGIQIPKSVQEAYAIDRETGTSHWSRAIEKEIRNVRIAFEKIDGVTEEQMRTGKVRPGYSHCSTHMIFDVKMDGSFTRKARLVADGHKTEPPTSMTYSSVVSRDSVRIALSIASLNCLEISSCDIGNAYLNAPCREKLWTVAGAEFGSEKGAVMIISRALYGLKSSGAAWRSTLAQTMELLGYKPTQADPDVWLKRAIKHDRTPYYKMMLIYVDDVLHLAEDPNEDMTKLSEFYRLKDGTGEPDRYLGGNIERVQTQDGSVAWSLSCHDYLFNAIKQVQADLSQKDLSLKQFGTGLRPYPASYRPEMDVTSTLDEDGTTKFQQLIGILRWAIELGRVDILTEVSCLSQHLAEPRDGHLLAVYKIFKYLDACLKKEKGRIVFDGKYKFVDNVIFNDTNRQEWEDFYQDANEEFPIKGPEPLGNPVRLSAYVDANHAGNLKTRRSHTGLLVYMNSAPILWYSKRQNTVETSSFGSEYIALRICTEMVEALRYKLRCFGIPIDGPCDIFCDNRSVVTNSSVPTSVLNKRHNAICYHRVREAQAAGVIRVGWIEGKFNIADLFTKTTLSNEAKRTFVQHIFNDQVTPLPRA